MTNEYIPRFIYGTAWKEELTEDLVIQALRSGFRAIDTANQRKHYFEESVGIGIQKFLETSNLKREDLFIQTKFTFARGQDHRKPYDEKAPIRDQVLSSFKSSLLHLKTDYLDSYLLHGPYNSSTLSPEDFEVWKTMEELYSDKKIHNLGVSNFTAQQLKELCDSVTVKPKFIQNRCYADKGWDIEVREVCEREDVKYQGFSILTANGNELSLPLISELAEDYAKTIPQIIFKFCMQIGIIFITGTSSEKHMRDDLNINDFELSVDEIRQIEAIANL
jgi:diketogulonate reductase-like aldo/keto reductase